MSSSLWHKGFPQFAGSDKSLIDVLESGELSETDYLAWATEEYQLPVVTADFFKSANKFNLLLDYPSFYWNPGFFPVSEWNGIVYVACLEPQPLELKKKHCLILGPYKEMKKHWEKMELPLEASVVIDALEFQESNMLRRPETATEKAPESFTFPEIKLESPPAAPVFDFGDLKFDAEPVAETPAEKPKAPLTPAPAKPVTPIVYKTAAEFERDVAEQLAREQAAARAAEHAKKMAEAKAAAAAIPPKPLRTPAPPVAPAAKPTVVPQAAKPAAPQTPSVKVSPNFTATNYEIPKEFAAEAAARAAQEVTNVANIGKVAAGRHDASFTATKTIMPFPDRSTQFTFTRTIYSSQVILEAEGKIQDNTDPQMALVSAFKILQNYYKNLMWVVRDQKGYAYPIACNADWEFTEDAWNEPVAFKHPNPFRIAKMTQKPYHGPVYSSPATDKYFKLWNSGKRPDFFSVVPIMMYGKVFGYLVGCEKGPHFNKITSLEIMEITGRELLETFIKIHKAGTGKAA